MISAGRSAARPAPLSGLTAVNKEGFRFDGVIPVIPTAQVHISDYHAGVHPARPQTIVTGHRGMRAVRFPTLPRALTGALPCVYQPTVNASLGKR